MIETRTLICDPTIEDVRQMANAVQQFAELHDVPQAVWVDLELALVEAANNIVQHGLPHPNGHTIALMIRTVLDGIEIVIEDSGIPIPSDIFANAREAGLHAESGRGIALMHACTDRLDYVSSSGLNRLTLFKAVALPGRRNSG